MKLYRTKDYDEFTSLKGNRDVDQKHVARLVNTISEHPQLAGSIPIIVNENLQVIDGQHRLEALKALNLDVPYLIIEGVRLEDVHVLNTTQKNWQPIDFASSYSQLGKTEYDKYLKLREQFPTFGHTIVLFASARSKGSKTASLSKIFKDGGYTNDRTDAAEFLSHLVALSEFSSVATKGRFTYALRDMYDVESYDPERMLSKAEMFADTLLKTRATTEEYRRDIENMYNFKSREDNRVRLY